MNSIEFLVQGSAPNPYRVTFELSGVRLSAFCTCPAGEKGQYCKHRFNILAGKTDGVVSNADQVALIPTWLPGTELKVALDNLAAAEAALEKAQKTVASAKKKVAAAMHA